VKKLDIMNVKPKLVPADFRMPPPKPRRAKRVVEKSDKQPKKCLKPDNQPEKCFKPLPTSKILEKKSPAKKSPAKKGKKSKQLKGFKKAKDSLEDMSNLYKGLE